MNIKKSIGEKTFDFLNHFFMIILMILTLYPFLYVAFASLSNPVQFMAHRGLLWKPIGFSIEGYRLVLKNADIITGYANTIYYVVIGTTLNVLMTSMFAYVLSRKNLFWKSAMMKMVVFTMFFGGGMIPNFLLIKSLGLYDSRWAIILPGLIGTMNLIIMRTSFMAIPESLEESARIDGANDMVILFKIILPLSGPTIAVMILFYGVGHWNAWFSAMIYLRRRTLFPLQLILREILIQSATEEMTLGTERGATAALSEIIKYATIMVATLPILAIYPFLQKYFVKGVMIGAVKG